MQWECFDGYSWRGSLCVNLIGHAGRGHAGVAEDYCVLLWSPRNRSFQTFSHKSKQCFIGFDEQAEPWTKSSQNAQEDDFTQTRPIINMKLAPLKIGTFLRNPLRLRLTILKGGFPIIYQSGIHAIHKRKNHPDLSGIPPGLHLQVGSRLANSGISDPKVRFRQILEITYHAYRIFRDPGYF